MYLSISQQMWIVLPMEKWSHATMRVVISKTWFTIQSEQESELVSSNVGEFIGSWTPRNGTLLCGSTPNGCEKRIQGVCPFHNGCLEGFAGPSLELVRGIRGENIELNSNVWDIQAYYIAQAAVNATVTFRPDVIVFGGRSHGSTTYVRSCSHEIYCPLERLPPVLMWDYIVTPAVAGNGSATLGNFVLAKEVSEKLKK